MQRICVFCGSSTGVNPIYVEVTQQLGTVLVERGLSLVYGGGCVGLMGVLADTMLAQGGEVIGVIPRHLMDKEVGHRNLTDLRVVESMHERKALMADLSDAFIALPGGFGTLEEMCEIITWAQLGLHHKPCGLLNVAQFYDALLAFCDHAEDEGFIYSRHRSTLLVADDAEELLDQFAAYQPPAMPKWLDPDER